MDYYELSWTLNIIFKKKIQAVQQKVSLYTKWFH